MVIIGADKVICDVCNAQPGEQCTFMYGSGGRRRRKFRHGYHAKRIRDADCAMQAVRALSA